MPHEPRPSMKAAPSVEELPYENDLLAEERSGAPMKEAASSVRVREEDWDASRQRPAKGKEMAEAEMKKNIAAWMETHSSKETLDQKAELTVESLKQLNEQAIAAIRAFDRSWLRAQTVVYPVEQAATLDVPEGSKVVIRRHEANAHAGPYRQSEASQTTVEVTMPPKLETAIRRVESAMARGALRKAMLFGALLGLGQGAVEGLRHQDAGMASEVAREVHRGEQAIGDAMNVFGQNMKRILEGRSVERGATPQATGRTSFEVALAGDAVLNGAVDLADQLSSDGTLERFADRPNEFRAYLSEALAKRLQVPEGARMNSAPLRDALTAAQARIYNYLLERMLTDRDPAQVARMAALGGRTPIELASDTGNMEIAAQMLHEGITEPDVIGPEREVIGALGALGMDRAPQVIAFLNGHDRAMVLRVLQAARRDVAEQLEAFDEGRETEESRGTAVARLRREAAALDMAIQAAGGVRVRRVASNTGR